MRSKQKRYDIEFKKQIVKEVNGRTKMQKCAQKWRNIKKNLNIIKIKGSVKMKKSKIIASIVGGSMIVLFTAMPILAAEPFQKAEPVQNVDYTEHKSAELDPGYIRAFGLFDDYRVYSDASWIVVNGVGVGAEGWTDIDDKSDGSDRYHYSNIQVYSDTQTWESGRKWGTGRVSVTTGNVGVGALSDYRLFYGF